MAGKINVYNLGDLGVNVVKSPLHLADGELTQAQNAAFNPEKGEGGLRKRLGMARLNASGIGSIGGVVNVPLPATITRAIYLSMGDFDTTTWIVSTDGGDSWSDLTSSQIARAQQYDKINAPFSAVNYRPPACAIGLRDRFAYALDDYTQYNAANHEPPPLGVFDGTVDAVIAHVPEPPLNPTQNSYMITCAALYRGLIYLGVADSGPSGRVLRVDLTTGEVQQIGNPLGTGTGATAGGFPVCLCPYQGYLYAGLHNVSGGSSGTLVRIIPGVEETWVAEYTGLQGYVMSLCQYRGDLYVGMQGDSAENALLQQRAAAGGALSTSDTGTGNASGHPKGFFDLIVYDDELYAAYHNTHATTVSKIRKFDGSSWSDDRDMVSSDSAGSTHRPGKFLVSGDDLFFVMGATADNLEDGFVLRKQGGTWDRILTDVNVTGFAVETVSRS